MPSDMAQPHQLAQLHRGKKGSWRSQKSCVPCGRIRAMFLSSWSWMLGFFYWYQLVDSMPCNHTAGLELGSKEFYSLSLVVNLLLLLCQILFSLATWTAFFESMSPKYLKLFTSSSCYVDICFAVPDIVNHEFALMSAGLILFALALSINLFVWSWNSLLLPAIRSMLSAKQKLSLKEMWWLGRVSCIFFRKMLNSTGDKCPLLSKRSLLPGCCVVLHS